MRTLTYGQELEPAHDVVLQGTYRLIRPIGQGAMGVVYEATHTRLPGRFAVKILRPQLTSSAEAFQRFCREAEIMSEVRHPHIVQIFDFNTTEDGLPYFVMEYLDGKSLEDELREVGKLPLAKVVPIVQQIASALGTAHNHGIIHRDLKPSNVFLLDIDGHDDQFVKVLDFGISKISADGGAVQRLTRSTEVMGTPHYMSPEQALGRGEEIDARTDQFALGAITYEMLTGEDAFVGEDPAALLYQVVHEDPRPLSQLWSGECTALQAVLSRALAKDPGHRYESILDFAHALESAAEAALCAMETPIPVVIRPPAAPLSRPAEVAAVANDTTEVAAVANDAVDAELLPRASRTDDPDWDLPSKLDRIPISPYRAVAMAALAAGLAALVVTKGWHREIPRDLAFARHNLMAVLSQPTPLPQPTAATAAPSAERASGAVTGGGPSAAAPSASAAPGSAAPPTEQPSGPPVGPAEAPGARQEAAPSAHRPGADSPSARASLRRRATPHLPPRGSVIELVPPRDVVPSGPGWTEPTAPADVPGRSAAASNPYPSEASSPAAGPAASPAPTSPPASGFTIAPPTSPTESDRSRDLVPSDSIFSDPPPSAATPSPPPSSPSSPPASAPAPTPGL